MQSVSHAQRAGRILAEEYNLDELENTNHNKCNNKFRHGNGLLFQTSFFYSAAKQRLCLATDFTIIHLHRYNKVYDRENVDAASVLL